MDRRILNVRVTQPVIDRLDALARDVGYSRAELARWVLITGCNQERLPPGYQELAAAKQEKDLGSWKARMIPDRNQDEMNKVTDPIDLAPELGG